MSGFPILRFPSKSVVGTKGVVEPALIAEDVGWRWKSDVVVLMNNGVVVKLFSIIVPADALLIVNPFWYIILFFITGFVVWS